VYVGADSEDDVRKLAGQIRREAPPDADEVEQAPVDDLERGRGIGERPGR